MENFEEMVLRDFFEQEYPELEFGKLKTVPRESGDDFYTVDLVYEGEYIRSFYRSAYGDARFYTPF